jgi:hypothetical protein
MEALALATKLRRERAELKMTLEAEPTLAAHALTHLPPMAEGMTIMEFLKAQKGWGVSKTRRYLRNHGSISENRKLRELTMRQRLWLASDLKQGE